MNKSIFAAAFVAVLTCAGQAHAQTVLADWTFETSQPAAAGPYSPEIGSGSATGVHAGASTYSSPSGNGSAHSFSSTTWAVGDYYQFSTSSTTPFNDLTLSFDQTSSNTGPKDFNLSYSTNGTNYTSFTSYSILANASPNAPWNATTYSSAYHFSYDLSSVDALNGATTVYFRLTDADTTSANGGTVASGGTDRVDNVVISEVPEPSTYALLALGMAGAFVAFRRLTRIA